MKFIPEYPIENLTPAPYNPRRISEESFQALVESIKEHGVIRPVIVSNNMTILAGHQRTRAMKAAGVKVAPAYMAEHEVSRIEELRFNQFHNAIDTEDHAAPMTVPPGTGWDVVDPAEVSVANPRRNGDKVTMGRLLLTHGPWSNAIATESGRVLVGSLYAAVSTSIGMPLLVRYVPDDRADAVLRSFGREYGEFNYSHIPMNQWHQATHQPIRFPGSATGGAGRAEGSHLQSSVYTLDVIPRLEGNETIFDLGSGRGAYARVLRKRGHEVVDIEFYRRRPGGFEVDHVTVQRQIDEFCEFVASGRRFDVVVLDSVLNSVGTPEAQEHVLNLLVAMVKPGGLIGMSGKSLEYRMHVDEVGTKVDYTTSDRMYQTFFDEDGRTALYSRGDWYFQKYHRFEEVHKIAHDYIGPDFWLYNFGHKRDFTEFNRGTPVSFRGATLWQLSGYRQVEDISQDKLIAAVEYEFNLPYRSGRTVDRVDDVMHALREGGFLTK